jgi:hypothetical protein
MFDRFYIRTAAFIHKQILYYVSRGELSFIGEKYCQMYSIWIILACVTCLFSVMISLCSGVITQILNVLFGFSLIRAIHSCEHFFFERNTLCYLMMYDVLVLVTPPAPPRDQAHTPAHLDRRESACDLRRSQIPHSFASPSPIHHRNPTAMPAAAAPAPAPPPPPPPELDARTGGRILRRAAGHLLHPASVPPLLLAALLLLLFRSALLAGTLRLASFADRDPALRSLLERLSPPAPSSPPPPPHHLPRRRSPFTSSSSLSDDDVLVGPLDPSSAPSSRRNASYYHVLFTSYSSPKPYPVPLQQPIPASVSPFLLAVHNDTAAPKPASPPGSELRLLDLTRRDAAAIINLLALLSSSHVLAILGYIAVHSAALGVVFASVTGWHVQGRRRGFLLVDAVMGARRLTAFAFLRWATRDAVVQMLCLLFFADVHDQAQLFRLFVVAKLMPFSASVNPWIATVVAGPELDGFFVAWAVLDAVVSVLFTVVPWVVVMERDPRPPGRNAVKEGCYLVSLMATDATLLKCWETLVCGSMGRLIMVTFCGKDLGGFLHSIAEVYFMAVWLLFYFAARCKEAQLGGRRFGMGDVAAALDGFR